MPPLAIPHLALGDAVQHELLVVEREEKQVAGGDAFVVLTLGNATGRIATAPIWSNQREWADGAERGRIVQAIGQVGIYQRTGKRQLQLNRPLRVIPTELVREDDFLPRIAGDASRLWDWIDRVRGELQSVRLRRVVGCLLGDDAFRLRFERTPGSVTGHHAKIGGLLQHTVEVTSIARSTAKTMRADVDLATVGALLHDIGKVDAYAVERFSFTHTTCGLLLGHVVIGCLMLERALAALDEPLCTPGQLHELQHMILSHHGARQFGSPVEPMTAEAEIVHWADEASAKANDMMESLEDPANFLSGSEISDRGPWRVGRRIWRRGHDWGDGDA